MCQPAQGCLDSTQDDGNIRIQLTENLRIDDGGVFRTQVMTPVRTVGILGAQASVSCVFIDHGVHTSRSNAKEQSGPSQLLEVTVVSVPVWLGYNGHPIACCFECASDDSCSKGWVVHIGIGREEDDIYLCPASQLHLLLRRREKIRQLHIIN